MEILLNIALDKEKDVSLKGGRSRRVVSHQGELF